MNEKAAKAVTNSVLPGDFSDEARRRRAELRRKAIGSLEGKGSLTLEEALAPLDEDELKRWYGD